MKLTQDQRDLLTAFSDDIAKRIDNADPFGPVYKPAQTLAAIVAAVLAEDASDYKDSVRAATTGTLPAYTRTGNYLNANSNGALNDTGIGGVTDLVVGDRVLVMHGTGADRGIYLVTDLGGASSKWQLTRASDAASSGDLNSGSRVFCEEGTSAAKTFILTTANPIVLNTTSQTWAEQSSTVTEVAVLLALAASTTAKDVGGAKVSNMADGTADGDAVTLGQLNKKIRLVADNTALKALDVTKLADKAVIYKEDTGQLFGYDADSAATEVLGPPALIVQPTTGAGRYIALTGGTSMLTVKFLRMVQDVAAVKAIDVTTIADKCLVYVEDLKQIFAYDSASVAAESGASPYLVIQPTAGAGRYLALTKSQPFTWFTASQISDPGAGDELPATADGTWANCNRQDQRAPCNGVCKVWYVGEDNAAGVDAVNTAIFKIIGPGDVVKATKTYNDSTPVPAAYTPGLIGSFAVTEGDLVGWECKTAGAPGTANLPKFKLQFDITPTA